MTITALLATRIKHMGILLGITALVSLIVIVRQSQNNRWLPESPLMIDSWEAVDLPFSQEYLLRLAMPNAREIEFRNPLDERVSCEFIAVRSFESYREPDLFVALNVSAQRSLPLFGPENPVRAWVLKSPRSEGRLMVFTWLQSPSGKTRIYGERGIQQGFPERLRFGWSGITSTEPQCIVRLFTAIAPTDKKGIQARRNLERIALGLYKHNQGVKK